MKFQFFESLSRKEAEKYLQNFLEVEGEALKRSRPKPADGLLLDFTLPSLAPLYEWVALSRQDHSESTRSEDS